MAILSIPDNIYERILTCIGYPIISESDMGLTKDQILDLLILPPLKNIYYKWFPILERSDYSTSASFEIDFPDEQTFGVVDIRLVWQGVGGAGRTGNPLLDQFNIRIKGQTRNKWNTGNDYGYTQVYYAEQAYSRARIQNVKALKQWVDYTNRKVKGYTNAIGKISITWAKWANDWSGVQFKFEEDVIKLCQSYVLGYFGRLLNQGTGDLPTELTGDDMISRSEDLEEQIIEKFKQYSKVVILRG